MYTYSTYIVHVEEEYFHGVVMDNDSLLKDVTLLSLDYIRGQEDVSVISLNVHL